MIYFSIRIARMRNSVPWSISRSWLPQAGQESNHVSGTNLFPHFRHRACGMSAAMSISASGEAVCDSRVRIQKQSELQSMPANLPTSSSMVVIRFPPRRSRSLSTISKMLYAKESSCIIYFFIKIVYDSGQRRCRFVRRIFRHRCKERFGTGWAGTRSVARAGAVLRREAGFALRLRSGLCFVCSVPVFSGRSPHTIGRRKSGEMRRQ